MTGESDQATLADIRACEAESKDRLRLWLKLLKVSRGIENQVRERFRTEFDFTLPRFDVLAALHQANRDLLMSEISSALRVSNGNITGIVDRMVADGQLTRVAVPGDRRATRVRLTEEGRKLFNRVAGAHESWIDGMLARVSGEDAKAMIAMLAPIAESTERTHRK